MRKNHSKHDYRKQPERDLSFNIRMKKSTITGILLFFILFFVSFYIENSKPINETTFRFVNKDNNLSIEGAISIDDIFYNTTNKGNVTISKFDKLPKNVSIIGSFNSKRFHLVYEFPKDYLNYSYIEFEVTNNEIEESENYFRLIDKSEKDNFYWVNGLHWVKMPITYRYKDKSFCSDGKIKRVEYAIEELNKITNGSVNLIETINLEADIVLICLNYGEEDKYNIEEEYGVLGTATPTIIENKIVESTIELYPENICGTYPIVEIHEILHSFGYEHNKRGGKSIMNPMFYSCDYQIEKDENGAPKIDSWIINDLIKNYGRWI
ncbi:MAG TPA: hypothetical protein VJK51_00970 [Candidatus Nanoarchaeia archaeon]|nr:hypothetical protein [Candidatus Nanoarchaeia archaeon]